MKIQDKSLGELLKQAGKINSDQIRLALEDQKQSREPIGKVLVRLGFVKDQDILQVLEGMTTLTFETGEEGFGLETYRVREVVPFSPLRPLPLVGAECAGVVALRGQVVPVLSLRALLGLPEVAEPKNTWFIVLSHGEHPFILWIDALREVLKFPMANIEPLPAYLYGKRSDLFYCLGKMNGRLYSMINPDRLIRDERVRTALEGAFHASPV
jgi:purine-binding chemotaxis protein CheW